MLLAVWYMGFGPTVGAVDLSTCMIHMVTVQIISDTDEFVALWLLYK